MINNYDIAVLSEKVAYLEAALKSAGIELPEVTSEDNGKTLQVVNGAWATGKLIPEVINALDSTSETNALSAAQGKAINDAKLNSTDFSAINLPNGIQTGTINTGTILDYVKTTLSGKTGVFLVYTQNATDSKEVGTVSLTMIIKPESNANYTQLIEFYSIGIYGCANILETTPSITWVKLSV